MDKPDMPPKAPMQEKNRNRWRPTGSAALIHSPVPRGRPAFLKIRLSISLSLIGLLVAAVVMLRATQQPAEAGRKLAQAEVTLEGKLFRVDVVDTPTLQAKGLGGRRGLSPTQGMLFVYADKSPHTFWMKGMVISIDIIWLDNRRVVHIEHKVPPPARGTPDHQLTTYAPEDPANMVLEIAAGRARAVGLEVGSLVRYRFNIP